MGKLIKRIKQFAETPAGTVVSANQYSPAGKRTPLSAPVALIFFWLVALG